MGAPRLSTDKEEARGEVVRHLDKQILRKDEALTRVAEAVRAICDVPMAHVSLMESEHQCVIGHAGFEMDRFDRNETFCAYTLAKGEVIIVEDASDDPRFKDTDFVQKEPGLSFYAGIPLVVEDAPVGTLCALDTEPRELELDRRGELFGLVHSLERHLQVVYHHEPMTPEHGLASKLTAIRSLAARERYRTDSDDTRHQSLLDLEAETKEAFEMLVELPRAKEIKLGMATTDLPGE